jgi:serine O-acetyltransferase
MNFKEYKYLVFSDLYRLRGQVTFSSLVRSVMWGEAFKYVFWMRTCTYAKNHTFLRYLVYPFARFFLFRLRYKLGISIPPHTKIGSGFYIGHFGGIVVNSKSVIGRNCNISPGVNVGQANRGRKKGYPTVGDNVYIGPGAKIVGAVTVGNNAAIGANAVVTKNVPDNAVVAGIPAEVISYEGSQGYVSRTDYQDKIN